MTASADAQQGSTDKAVTRHKVYHPNIDLDGNVCLNILREDWKPVLSISSIIYGLQFLFLVRLCADRNWLRCVCYTLASHVCSALQV